MKKNVLIMMLVTGILFLFQFAFLNRNYGILPKEANYDVIFEYGLYTLTPSGLVEKGCIFDSDKWQGKVKEDIVDIKFNEVTKMLYFHNYYGDISPLYKIGLNDFTGTPKAIPYTNNVHEYSVSPNGDLLVFENGGNDRSVYLLNLTNNNLQKIDEVYGNFYRGFCWINSRQFIYYKKDGDKDSAIFKLLMFDAHSMVKKDTKLGDCYPGAITLDRKKIFLSGHGKQHNDINVIYSIDNKTVETVIDKSIYAHNMIWLPDGKGFLYNARHWRDFIISPEGFGLYYYSLEKKKSVRLAGPGFTLRNTGGFFVPPGITIKLPNIKCNREISKYPNKRLIKICTKRFNLDWFK